MSTSSIASLALATTRPPVFDCSLTDRGRDTSCVHLGGELDIATSPVLDEVLCASLSRGATARAVVLDLRDLEFVDASGVHTITAAGMRARETGGRLILVRGPPAVDRVFTLTGTSRRLEIVDLTPAEPAVMALLRLAQAEVAA